MTSASEYHSHEHIAQCQELRTSLSAISDRVLDSANSHPDQVGLLFVDSDIGKAGNAFTVREDSPLLPAT